MNSCSNKCCFWEPCSNDGTYPINMARNHKVCNNHYHSISNYPNLTCPFCQVKCKIALNLIKPLTQKQCKNCSIAINSNSNHCQACEKAIKDTNFKCNICGKSPIIVSKKVCGHLVCSACSKGQVCNNCFKTPINQLSPNLVVVSKVRLPEISKSNQKCGNCGYFGNISTRICSHVCCEYCIGQNCVFCSSGNKSNSKNYSQNNTKTQEGFSTNEGKIVERCQNCGQIGLEAVKKCGHAACQNCLDYYPCVFCNYKCSNCKGNGTLIYIEGCNHMGCNNCAFLGCNQCKKKRLCGECKIQPISNVIGECDHGICFACTDSNKKCSICFKKCEKCKAFKKKIEDFSHKGEICNRCFQNYKLDIISCKKCGNEGFYNAECGHTVCIYCFQSEGKCSDCQKNSYASFRNDDKKCVKCKKDKSILYLQECGHINCVFCYQEMKLCKICTQFQDFCKFCLSSDNPVKLQCGHISCKNCNKNKICYDCVTSIAINQNNYSYFLCIICNNSAIENITLRCNHPICSNCYSLDFKRLDYICIKCCIQYSGKTMCITCGEIAKFKIIDGNILEKSCCEIYICRLCSKMFRSNDHKCSIKSISNIDKIFTIPFKIFANFLKNLG